MFLSPARCAFTESSVPPARGLSVPGAVAGPRGRGRGTGDPRGEPRAGRIPAQRPGKRKSRGVPLCAGGSVSLPLRKGVLPAFPPPPLRRALEETTFP